METPPWMKTKRKINWSWCTMPPLSKEKEKEKEKWYQIKEELVVLYVDQQDCVRHKFDDLCSNWLDVFFNLTKYIIGSLLSDQFQNIELDSKLYSLENQYLCFYVGSLIHWWLCIRFSKLRLWLILTFDLETSFFMDWCIQSKAAYLIYY